jgi:anti-sigma B factor antagonist
MSTPSNAAKTGVIEIERLGDVTIITPATEVETMQWELIEQAAEIVLIPLKRNPSTSVVVDLSRVAFFGSVFLSLLLRCHKLVKQQGGDIVLCGVSDRARELLKITNLDTLWAIYKDRQEALAAVAG